MNEPKLALKSVAQESPKVEAIKKVVTRKLYGHQAKKKTLHQQINATGVDVLLEAWHGVWMIFPAIIIGIMSGIGAAFEIGTKKALETYRGK
jgi:hypothetical protein